MKTRGAEYAFDAKHRQWQRAGRERYAEPESHGHGANSHRNVGRALTLYGDLDVLNGGAVNVGNIQVAGVSGARKLPELTIAGSGSRFTSGSSVNVGDYGNGVLAVMDGGRSLRRRQRSSAGQPVPVLTAAR